MEQFFTEHWEWLAGIIGILMTYLVPGLRWLWVLLFKSLVTKRALIKVVLYFGDDLVKSKKTNLDDAIWVDVRKALMKELM